MSAYRTPDVVPPGDVRKPAKKPLSLIVRAWLYLAACLATLTLMGFVGSWLERDNPKDTVHGYSVGIISSFLLLACVFGGCAFNCAFLIKDDKGSE